MYIDKYKKGEYWIDEHGGQYLDVESFIEIGLFGFCGCGNPPAIREYVRKSLQLVADRKEKGMDYEEWIRVKTELFKTDEAELFMWYWLDNNAYTEHGSLVPGWLTADGEEMLSDLNELYKKELNQ